MLHVLKRERKRIAEYGDCFVKAHPVLFLVASRLGGVPLGAFGAWRRFDQS